MSFVIEVSNLSKHFTVKTKQAGFRGILKNLFFPKYKQVRAVDNISFNIKEGELVGFIGPNGAGKSTTIKMMTGILFPSKGKVTVLNHIPQEERVELAYKIGTIFGQRQQLLYHLPPIDSFNLFAKIYEINEEEYQTRLKDLVKLFGIEEILQTPVRKLSLGQRMKCEFIASILHKPKILFLDEPTIGLDILAKKHIRDLIRKLNKYDKTTVILTSHDLDDIEELCERVIVINRGKILYDGSVEKIKKKLKYKILDIYLHEPITKSLKIKHTKVLELESFRIKIQLDRTKTSIRNVLDKYFKKYKVDDIVIEDPPIEDVIEKWYA